MFEEQRIVLTTDAKFLQGLSAYEVAKEKGFPGSEEEWLESLKYDHSPEFLQLVEDVKKDLENYVSEAKTAKEGAEEILSYTEAFKRGAKESADKAEEAKRTAEQSAEGAKASEEFARNVVNGFDARKDSALLEIDARKATAVETVGAKEASAIAEVERVKATIPADYSALQEKVSSQSEEIENISNDAKTTNIMSIRERRDIIGTVENCNNIDIVKKYTGGAYAFEWVPLNLSTGNYRIYIDRIDLPTNGFVRLRNKPVGANITEPIMEKTAVEFQIPSAYDGENGILVQYSMSEEERHGIYGAYKINVFRFDVSQAFNNTLLGKMHTRMVENKAEMLTGYDGISVNAPNSKQNNSIGFTCNIDSNFAGIQIVHGSTKPYASASIRLYTDKFDVYKYTTGFELVGTYNLGFNLDTFVEANINVAEDGKCRITISSISGTYTVDDIEFNGCHGAVTANPMNCTITNCHLTFCDNDKNKRIWLFGDSYMDHYPLYMHSYGAKNFAIDGFSGRNSADAWWSLSLAIKNSPVPNTLIWALGMNDGDADNIVNANWKNYYDLVSDMCDTLGIELILVTVPNTPKVINRFKNSVIRNSGRRYVDLAEAVGSDKSSNWYTGLLSGDNVHASVQGRKVMALRMIADVPELV